MPLGTLDRTAPPLFNQGPSALSRLVFFSALALLLMVADARFDMVTPVRQAVGAVLYPLQWLALKPVEGVVAVGRYFDDLQSAQRGEAEARRAMVLQAERASQADALAADNARLRALLELRQTTTVPGRAAEVLYDTADPYTRKIVIDQGQSQGIRPGSPVIDESGVLGQVTLVQPFGSEVTLVVDRELSIPVQNARTGVRGVAFGDATAGGSGMELRFTSANADVQEGDLLVTSGVDGVYPAGLPVARIDRIDRRADTTFARIHCVPLARVGAVRYVMVLTPVGAAAPVASAPPAAPEAGAPPAPAQQQPSSKKPESRKSPARKPGPGRPGEGQAPTQGGRR